MAHEAATAHQLLGVGEVSRRSGVSASALHFYERNGLVSSERTAGNQRRYRRDTLRRVAFIRVSQRVGIPLKDILAALESLPESRTPTKRDWERLSRLWRSELDARIAALEHLRHDLDGCIGCGCLSLKSCQLQNPGDALAGDGDGPVRWRSPGAARPHQST
ncbi:MerR family transcriptional regulator [Arthrobacter sp. ZBG10]|uniref:redox-sensitive transcriptional activator SoxR n=1 Tax=Micrococcaceae TaxID=1268 RepID=UPI00067FB0F4|nr:MULTISPECIES: redox-sensitive transcriptional activator SoxR [Micrococcaceae]KNH16432.1 MerR family transcriptional regulator [Arthrobacter sp. ZBG10]KQR04173.1 MerR family transcriptional regulator [Arthrobacter sp. Leaf141]